MSRWMIELQAKITFLICLFLGHHVVDCNTKIASATQPRSNGNSGGLVEVAPRRLQEVELGDTSPSTAWLESGGDFERLYEVASPSQNLRSAMKFDLAQLKEVVSTVLRAQVLARLTQLHPGNAGFLPRKLLETCPLLAKARRLQSKTVAHGTTSPGSFNPQSQKPVTLVARDSHQHDFDGRAVANTLGEVVGLDLAIQMSCFVAATALKTEKFYDLSGSVTYISCVLLSLRKAAMHAAIRPIVNSAFVLTWAARLGSFLFMRILKDGKDSRFDNLRDKPAKFVIAWFAQAVWIFLTALPVYIINAKNGDRSLSWPDYLGWSIWLTGFVTQFVADAQKLVWRSKPENRGKWINEGLWRYSQHPNYLGEMAMWWGIFLSASQALQGVEYLSVISPIFVTFLLTQVSGIPMLRKAGMKKWGHIPEYQEYLRKTPVLFPLPWFKRGKPRGTSR